MGKISGEFSMEDAVRFVNSPAGQQLLTMLKNSGDPALRTAMEQAAKGDLTGAKESLSAIAASEEIQQILKKTGNRHG